MQRLSGFDAAFLHFETPTNHMHVGLVGVFDPSTAPGGYSFVGMTTSDQGVAVPANVSLRAVWFTYDGGAHWLESPVR